MVKQTRRSFMASSIKVAAGLAILPYSGCMAAPWKHGVVPPDGYPLIEAEGSYQEIGYALGSAMKKRILAYFDCSPDFPRCRDYLQTRNGAEQLQRMLGHVEERFPHLAEELKGMAEGLGLEFMTLFAYNCRSEISVLRSGAGCSTLALQKGGRTILCHNEDGGDTNVGSMYLARVRPSSGVDFVAFVYPGLLPGNGPGFNGKGIAQTTNYIQPHSVADGVPRYFIGRAVLEAESLDDAVNLVTTTPRAFAWHHNLVDLKAGRIVSLETMPDRNSLKEINGFQIHTNHLIHPEMAAKEGQEGDIPYESSLTRMRVLSQAVEKNGAPEEADGMVRLLCLHEGRPYSPCRHPEGEIHGITLGTAVFEAPHPAMTLYHGNPCRGLKRRYIL